MTEDLDDLLGVLDLEPVAGGFRGETLEGAGGVVFGGQLLAQSIVAATGTVPDKEIKSLQTVFMRAARSDTPIDFDVEPMHDGRAFSSVTITVRQGDRVCARSLALLHVPDEDLIRAAERPPPAGDPEALPDRGHEAWWSVRYPADIDISDPEAVGPAELNVWTRFPSAPPELVISQALLAYASDGFLIATAMRPHKGVGQSQAHVSVTTTVLTHAISFHEPFLASEWMLLAHESPVAGRGRSYGRANVFTTDGRLTASFVQDNLIRANQRAQA